MKKNIYTIKEIINICTPIFKKYNIKKAYLFGSYARNEANEESDIDIMICTTGSDITTLLKMSALETDLEEKLGKPVDILTEETYTKQINERDIEGTLAKKLFFNEVLKDRRVLYD